MNDAVSLLTAYNDNVLVSSTRISQIASPEIVMHS